VAALYIFDTQIQEKNCTAYLCINLLSTFFLSSIIEMIFNQLKLKHTNHLDLSEKDKY